MIPRIRLFFQAGFLALSLAAFFGWAGTPIVHLYNAIHIFPALSSLFWFALPPLLWATVLFLVLPLAVGRLYCSYLCPAGLFQDLAAGLAKAFGAKQRTIGDRMGLRLFILLMAAGFLVLRSSSFHYLDHFSNLGRAYSLVLTAMGAIPFGWDTALGLIFLALVTLLPWFYPRWFCNALCPSGTLFMFLQKRSLYRIRMTEACTLCRLCEPACPSLCIREGKIDGNRCIHCLECITACPEDAVVFSYAGPFSKKAAVQTPAPPVPAGILHVAPASAGARSFEHGDSGTNTGGRRKFLLEGASALAGLAAATLLKGQAAAVDFTHPRTVVPPGGGSAARFFERCAACDACVAVCPTRVLVPSSFENSWPNLAKVRMDFDRAYCDYECNACLSVCPTGAISYHPLEQKKRIKIGYSRLEPDLCIPYRQGLDCAACQEVCPTGAIVMVPFGSIYAPTVKGDYCIGCGACQFVCPVRPTRAIRVTPLALHTFAYNPELEGTGKQPLEPPRSGFPF